MGVLGSPRGTSYSCHLAILAGVDLLLDFILPSTDAWAIAQAVIFGAVVGVAFWFARRRPEPRIFVIGVALLGFSLLALRAVH